MRDDQHRNGLTEEEQRRVIGCAFGAAVVAAPFVALLYSQEIGLTVLAAALCFTVYFARQAYREAEPGERRRQLLALLAVNAVFLAAVAVVLIWLLVG